MILGFPLLSYIRITTCTVRWTLRSDAAQKGKRHIVHKKYEGNIAAGQSIIY